MNFFKVKIRIKAQAIKSKLPIIKIKNLCVSEDTTIKKVKYKLKNKNRRKILQIIYLNRNLYLEYINHFYKSIVKR